MIKYDDCFYKYAQNLMGECKGFMRNKDKYGNKFCDFHFLNKEPMVNNKDKYSLQIGDILKVAGNKCVVNKIEGPFDFEGVKKYRICLGFESDPKEESVIMIIPETTQLKIKDRF